METKAATNATASVNVEIPGHGYYACTVAAFLWHRQRPLEHLQARVRSALEGDWPAAEVDDFCALPHDTLAVVVGDWDGATPTARLADVCDRDLREAVERCLSPEDRARVVVAENTYPSMCRLADAVTAGALPDGTTVLVAMRNHRALRIEDVQAVATGRSTLRGGHKGTNGVQVITINESDLARLERLRDADLPGDLVLLPYVGARLTTERFDLMTVPTCAGN